MKNLKTNQIAHIEYTNAREELTERHIIPTFVPEPRIKALDVTDLSEDERDELKTLYEEYTQYYNDFVRQIFSFDDWVNHTHNKDISDLKWRTFKINKTKILD